MKTRLILFIALMFIGILPGYSQLFPTVNRPSSDEMSMLVLQFGHMNEGEYDIVTNMNFTGWVPAVKGADGEIVQFRTFDSGVDITNIYYAENLEAGEYTLTGFYHIYNDYSLLREYRESINNSDYRPRYAPYANKPYQVKQFIALDEDIIINLEPNSMASLGSFAVKFRWLLGATGTSDDRWKVVDKEITMVNPFDDHVLRYMKPWRTRAWRGWNAKNPAEPL